MLGLTEVSDLGTCRHVLDAEDIVVISPARGFPARVTPGSPFLQSSLWWPVEAASSCGKASRNRPVYHLQVVKSNQTNTRVQ